MADYEKSLRNAIKKSFPDSVLLGCSFHYFKCIIKKFKSLGLFNKKSFVKSYKLLFFLNYILFYISKIKRNY